MPRVVCSGQLGFRLSQTAADASRNAAPGKRESLFAIKNSDRDQQGGVVIRNSEVSRYLEVIFLRNRSVPALTSRYCEVGRYLEVRYSQVSL